MQALAITAPNSFSRSSRGELQLRQIYSKNGISLDMRPSSLLSYVKAAYSFSISSIRCVHKPLLRHLVKDFSFAENQALALAAGDADIRGGRPRRAR